MSEPVTLTLTLRDLQWIAATMAVASGMLVDDGDYKTDAYNLNALGRLLTQHYSATEANALLIRVRELIPIDAQISFSDPDAPFAPGTPNMVS